MIVCRLVNRDYLRPPPGCPILCLESGDIRSGDTNGLITIRSTDMKEAHLPDFQVPTLDVSSHRINVLWTVRGQSGCEFVGGVADFRHRRALPKVAAK